MTRKFCDDHEWTSDVEGAMCPECESVWGGDKPKKVRPKPRYKMADPMIISCLKLWPHIAEGKGKFVAVGNCMFPDGEPMPNTTRTSVIINVNLEEGYIETLNSIYEIV